MLSKTVRKWLIQLVKPRCAIYIRAGYVLEPDGTIGKYADVWTTPDGLDTRIYSGDWTRPEVCA